MSRLNRFLDGVKVLDLSQYLPGPMASLVLADLGAEVLKIEPPGGDEMRRMGPQDAAGKPVFYNALNAGKTVRRMNLKEPAQRAIFLDLVRVNDVLIEGFRPGVMARLGIDYSVLSAANPRLIMCSLSGYGQRGGAPGKAGHDGNYLAMAGVLDRNGKALPIVFDPPPSDGWGSLFAAIAILGALNSRNATDRGCAIDIGLADTVMLMQLMQIADWGANGTVPKPETTYLNGGAAYYHVYATGDGRHVMLGSVEPKFWRAFCAVAKRPDWSERQSESLPQLQLIAELSDFFVGLSLAEVIERFADADCCLSPVLDLGEALTSEQTRSRRLVRTAPRSGELQALFPAYVDGVPPALRNPLVVSQAER